LVTKPLSILNLKITMETRRDRLALSRFHLKAFIYAFGQVIKFLSSQL
jgi:hypothetical protein